MVFKSEPGVKYPGTLGFSIDVKYNGYILLAPSTFEGGTYHWINSKEPAAAPSWLNAWQSQGSVSLTPQRPLDKTSEVYESFDFDRAVKDAKSGLAWHTNVMRIVGSLVARGLEDEQIYAFTDDLTLKDYTVVETRSEVKKMLDWVHRTQFDQLKAADPVEKASAYLSLQLDGRGKPLCNHSNLVKLFTEHADWAGALATDDFEGKRKVIQPIPNDRVHKHTFKPRQLEDEDFTRVSMWLNEHKFLQTQKSTVVDAIHKACSEQSFNPVKDYLQRCRSNCAINETLFNEWMMRFLGVETSTEDQRRYVEAVSRLSLIQAVARVFEPGCKADSVVILEGSQGTGKSTCLSILFSPEYFGDQLPPMTSKDASSYLRGKWCIELAELEYKRKTEIEAIKAFISRTHENYRPAFGREEITQPRTCVFWGTTNKDDYLNDETGNRRFLPIKTNEIDLVGMRKARDSLWGAAVNAYFYEEPYWLTGDLSQIAADEAKSRMEQDPWCESILGNMKDMKETSIRDAFIKCFPDETDISKGMAANRRMAKALTLCGWERAGKFNSGVRRNQVRFQNTAVSS